MGIIDLDYFDVIDLVNNKDIMLLDGITSNKKTSLIIVNRAYMTTNNKYETINKSDIGLILYDECHNCTAKTTFHMLSYFNKSSIIGFSATPIRRGHIKKVTHIFGDGKTVNFISMYSLLNAIADYDKNIENSAGCLPIKFHLFEIENKHLDDIDFVMNSYIDTLINIYKELPYKKILLWCNTIEECKLWYTFIKKHQQFNKFNIYISNCEDDGYSDEYNVDEDTFFSDTKKSIMVCVNRYREGSDIDYLDCGMYINCVKNRGEIPTIQCAGRVTRPDNNRLKSCGHIIDRIVTNGNPNIWFEKIISYYTYMFNFCDREQYELINEIDKLKKTIKIDEDKRTVRISIDQKEIGFKIHSNKIDMSNFKEDFITYINVTYHNEVFIQPLSNNFKVIENYDKTIKIKPNISNIVLKNDERVWGLSNGSGNKQTWSNMQIGNIYILFKSDKLFIGKIVRKEDSSDISKELWNDEIFRYIIIFKLIGSKEIGKKEFTTKLGYKETYNPRGCIRVSNVNIFLRNLIEEFTSQDKTNTDPEQKKFEWTEQNDVMAILCAKFPQKHKIEKYTKKYDVSKDQLQEKIELYIKMLNNKESNPSKQDKKRFKKYENMNQEELKKML